MKSKIIKMEPKLGAEANALFEYCISQCTEDNQEWILVTIPSSEWATIIPYDVDEVELEDSIDTITYELMKSYIRITYPEDGLEMIKFTSYSMYDGDTLSIKFLNDLKLYSQL